MKMKVFNPTNVEVNIKLRGVRVVIAPGEEELVDGGVAKEMREIQPQLHYFEIDDATVMALEKEAIAKMKIKLAEVNVEKEELEGKLAEVKKENRVLKDKIVKLEKVEKPKPKKVVKKVVKAKPKNKSNKPKAKPNAKKK